MIAKKDLVHGQYYKGRCRNATIARWNGERGVFVHWQYECGFKFTTEICHPEDDKVWDVFIPEECVDPDEEIALYV